MSILSGWLKTRAYRKTADGYKKESRDTSSETVYMNDGNTAETNLGDIKGITDSLTATSSNVALSAKGGNSLQGQIDTINSNLNSVEYVEWVSSINANKVGHTIEIFNNIRNLGSGLEKELGYTVYKPNSGYTILPLYSSSAPYSVIGSVWIGYDGKVTLYKTSATDSGYISGNYIFR